MGTEEQLEPAAERAPVRLTSHGDLDRGRGGVFFRIWFAAPLILWLLLWSVAALLVAIVNWLLTLITGRPPAALHSFLARYVRYATQVIAYASLGSEHLPAFTGRPGYEIDVEIDPPAPQNRWRSAFRIVLATPALLLAGLIAGPEANIYNVASSSFALGSGGLLCTAAFLGWFSALARGRIPRGLRDAIAYGVSYGAQTWAFLLLLTDRYPSTDPLAAIGTPPVREDPVRLRSDEGPRRSRLTVLLRLPLAVPHLLWLTLWGILALLAAVANWFATLVTGTSPRGLQGFLVRYVRYQTHVYAFLCLVGNPFPGFAGAAGSYPVEIEVAEPTRQNRWTVLLRAPLALPALLIAGAYGTLLYLIAIFAWFAGLFTARMPDGFQLAGELSLRYMAQTSAYLYLVTGSYPYSGPCLTPPSPPALPTTPAPPPAIA